MEKIKYKSILFRYLLTLSPFFACYFVGLLLEMKGEGGLTNLWKTTGIIISTMCLVGLLINDFFDFVKQRSDKKALKKSLKE